MEKAWIFVGLLILFILPISCESLSSPETNSPPSIEIGYTPSRLFDADLGVPVFMPNETVWVNVSVNASVRLEDPFERTIISRRLEASSPTRLYTFKPGDKGGVWKLETQEKLWSKTILINLIAQQRLSASMQNPVFSLNSGRLQINGTISLNEDISHGGGELLLVRRGVRNTTYEVHSRSVTRRTPYLRIVHGSPSSGSITLVPYFPAGPQEDVSTTIWAEIVLETPFIKNITATPVVIYRPEVALRTRRIPWILSNQPNSSIILETPETHTVGEGGSVPFRLGKGRVIVYLQVEDLIYVLEVPIYFLPEGLGEEVVDVEELLPMASSVKFSLSDDLISVSEYDMVLMAQIDGVDVFWNSSVTPPLAKVIIYNDFSKEPVVDYQLDFQQGDINTAKVAGETYTLLSSNMTTKTAYGLTVEGVTLLEEDAEPRLLALTPLTTENITVRLGKVDLYVKDFFGSPVPSGNISVSRIFEGTEKPVGKMSWSSLTGYKRVTLPAGTFRLTVQSGEAVESRVIVVNQPSPILVKLRLLGLPNPTEIALTLLGVFILAIEVALAYKVWAQVFRVRRRQTR